MRSRTLLAAGVTSFLLVLVATTPVALLAGRLPASMALDGAYGTVFAGGAERLIINGAPLGPLTFAWRPAALLRGALGYHLVLSGPAAHAEGDLAVGFAGSVALDHVALDLPLAALSTGSGPAAAIGGAGRVSGTIERARLSHGWPSELDARLTLEDLHPSMMAAPVGNYELRFAPGAGPVTGHLKDTKAPLALDAQLVFKPDHTYAVEGTVAARADAPKDLAPTLSMLGAPDANGRHRFSVGGTF